MPSSPTWSLPMCSDCELLLSPMHAACPTGVSPKLDQNGDYEDTNSRNKE